MSGPFLFVEWLLRIYGFHRPEPTEGVAPVYQFDKTQLTPEQRAMVDL